MWTYSGSRSSSATVVAKRRMRVPAIWLPTPILPRRPVHSWRWMRSGWHSHPGRCGRRSDPDHLRTWRRGPVEHRDAHPRFGSVLGNDHGDVESLAIGTGHVEHQRLERVVPGKAAHRAREFRRDREGTLGGSLSDPP